MINGSTMTPEDWHLHVLLAGGSERLANEVRRLARSRDDQRRIAADHCKSVVSLIERLEKYEPRQPNYRNGKPTEMSDG